MTRIEHDLIWSNARLRKFLIGETGNLHADAARDLAKYLGYTLEELAGPGPLGPPNVAIKLPLDSPTVDLVKLSVVGSVESGAYREPDTPPGQSQPAHVPAASVRGGRMRFALEQRDRLFAGVHPIGSVLICERPSAADDEPAFGMDVLVETWRGGLVEITCRRLAQDGSNLSLEAIPAADAPPSPVIWGPADDRPPCPPPWFQQPLEPKPDGVYVVAVVVASYEPKAYARL